MNLATLMTDLAVCNAEVKVNNVVTQTSLGLSSIQMGFLSDLNVQDEIFPLCLVAPPDGELAVQDEVNIDHLDIYIVALDHSPTEGKYTPSERPAVWDTLKGIGRTLLVRLMALNTQGVPKYQVTSKVTYERNYGDDLAQPCIWMKFKLTVKTADCV